MGRSPLTWSQSRNRSPRPSTEANTSMSTPTTAPTDQPTDVVEALLIALDRADVCRDLSPADAVCVPCWDAVWAAAADVRATRKPAELTKIPVD